MSVRGRSKGRGVTEGGEEEARTPEGLGREEREDEEEEEEEGVVVLEEALVEGVV